jgi:hypothetical protein
VNAEARLDPEGELFISHRQVHRAENCRDEMVQLSHHQERAQIIESEEMKGSTWRVLSKNVPPSGNDNDIVVTAGSTTLRSRVENSMDLPKILHEVYHWDAMFS